LRKWIAIGLAIFIAALAGATVHFRPDRAIRLATSSVAHMICTKAFVSGLEPQAVFAETMDRPGFRRLRHVMTFEIDRKTRAVEAATLGLFKGQASFHDGFGCVEQHGGKEPYLLRNDVETLRMSREVGGTELPSILRALAASLRQEAAVRSEVEARQSWVLNAARLGVASPWIVLLMLASRGEAAAAYNSPAGMTLLVVGFAVTVLAYRLMVGRTSVKALLMLVWLPLNVLIDSFAPYRVDRVESSEQRVYFKGLPGGQTPSRASYRLRAQRRPPLFGTLSGIQYALVRSPDEMHSLMSRIALERWNATHHPHWMASAIVQVI